MPFTDHPATDAMADPFLNDRDEPNDAFYQRAQTSEPKFIQAPKVVGTYWLSPSMYGGGCYTPMALSFIRKPNWFHRLCMRAFLGFVWKDAP